MRLHERDVVAREQPLELLFRERKDRIGDLARPGKARRLQALDPQGKAGLVVSRPGDFHPKPLAEPYVTLSRHTAPVIHRVRIPDASGQTTAGTSCASD